MRTMRVVGDGYQLPTHPDVEEQRDEYVVELEVAEFKEPEIAVEALGSQITVRCNDVLEEVFSLPNDSAVDRVRAFYRHGTLSIHAPRATLEPRRVTIEHQFHLVNPDAEPC